MTREISFFIPGVPGTKGSWAALRPKLPSPMPAYRAAWIDAWQKMRIRLIPSHSKRLQRWENAIKRTLAAYQGARWRLSTEPVHVDIEFRFERPATHVGKRGLRKAGREFPAPTTRSIGDGDKLTRAVWDALVPRVIADDSMIASWSGAKRWCEPGEGPGAMITIRDHQSTNRPDGPESEKS